MDKETATDTESYETLPQSRRPDGTLRPAVRVKKGYVPPEEQEKYDRWKSEPQVGVVGDDSIVAVPRPTKSKTALKNEKRAARRKAEQQAEQTAAAEDGDAQACQESAPADEAVEAMANGDATPAAAPAAAPATEPPREEGSTAEVEKKLKNLKKRLRQIEELEEKKMSGATLNSDQCIKVAAKAEVEAEIAKWEALGDTDIGKRVKALKKKTRQIEELEERQKKGEALNTDQTGKLDAKQAVLSELHTLEEMLAKM